MTSFRQWQAIRKSGVQHKESADAAAIKKILAPGTSLPKKDK
jgi:hypothetical protein